MSILNIRASHSHVMKKAKQPNGTQSIMGSIKVTINSIIANTHSIQLAIHTRWKTAPQSCSQRNENTCIAQLHCIYRGDSTCKQPTQVSGSGFSWAICKSAPCSRQITTPAPHHSVFTGQMPFLLPNQQRQCTEGKNQKS